MITITLATWLFRRKAVNAHRKEVGEMEQDAEMAKEGGRDEY